MELNICDKNYIDWSEFYVYLEHFGGYAGFQ